MPGQVGECSNAPLLGAAVLAAALPGSLHGPPVDAGVGDAESGAAAAAAAAAGGLVAAVAAMVRAARTVAPHPEAAAAYDELYGRVYSSVAAQLAPLSHRLGRGAATSARAVARAQRPAGAPPRLPSDRAALVLPSLLSADATALGSAARDAAAAGATWLHVDVFDGSPFAGGALSSMGPATVAALRAMAPSLRLDVHLGVAHQAAVAEQVAAALGGVGRITLQWEALAADGAAAAEALARRLGATGCTVGVCVAPSTPVEEVAPLLEAGVVDLVDVLAVEPGWGGQPFQPAMLDKVRWLRAHYPRLEHIMLDGGINAETARAAAAAGANVLVAGSYLFGSDDMASSFDALEEALLTHGE